MDIRQIRKSKGISLAHLSLSLGISGQNLSRYELGKRCWPAGLLQKVQAYLGLEVTSLAPEALSWSAHRLLGQWSRWQTHVDPGLTWADCPPGYAQAYRRLAPKHTPSAAFRSLVRCDSGLECLAWSLLCERGARPICASPALLGNRSVHLVDHRGDGLGLDLKAGIWISHKWILWPQVSVAVQGKILRPDALVMAWRGTSQNWGFVEIDGTHHREDDWQDQRGLALRLPIFRWSQEQITNLVVAAELKRFLGD